MTAGVGRISRREALTRLGRRSTIVMTEAPPTGEIRMGRVTEKIKLSNFIAPEKSVEVEALVDTGAMMLVLPQNIVDELGLSKIEERAVRYADNRTAVKTLYGVVRLEINGRVGNFDVIAELEGAQPLLGQIPLEHLDLIVDPVARTVLPNPRSPDMPMVDLL